jgi:hypothetical protein
VAASAGASIGIAQVASGESSRPAAVKSAGHGFTDDLAPRHAAEKPQVQLTPEGLAWVQASTLRAIQQYKWESTAFMLNTAYHGGLTCLANVETGQNWTKTTGTFTGGIGVMQKAYEEHKDPDMPANQGDASPAVQMIVAYRIAEDVEPRGTFGAQKWPNTYDKCGLP